MSRKKRKGWQLSKVLQWFGISSPLVLLLIIAQFFKIPVPGWLLQNAHVPKTPVTIDDVSFAKLRDLVDANMQPPPKKATEPQAAKGTETPNRPQLITGSKVATKDAKQKGKAGEKPRDQIARPPDFGSPSIRR